MKHTYALGQEVVTVWVAEEGDHTNRWGWGAFCGAIVNEYDEPAQTFEDAQAAAITAALEIAHYVGREAPIPSLP